MRFARNFCFPLSPSKSHPFSFVFLFGGCIQGRLCSPSFPASFFFLPRLGPIYKTLVALFGQYPNPYCSHRLYLAPKLISMYNVQCWIYWDGPRPLVQRLIPPPLPSVPQPRPFRSTEGWVCDKRAFPTQIGHRSKYVYTMWSW